MKNTYKIYLLVLLSSIAISGYAQPGAGDGAAAIKELLTAVNYGVPASPAFELLPGKASEVTHLNFAHDIGVNAGTFFNGSKLQAGAAVDLRPFSFTGGDLKQYQENYLTRLAWRTTVALGTTSGKSGGNDVFLGVGLRITLIDKSDPKNDKAFTQKLADAYDSVLFKITPDLEETLEQFQERVDMAGKSPSVQRIRDEFTANTWNALRWDVGLGASDRAASGYLKRDSLFRDRIGLWSALGLPLGKKAQLTISGNSAWVSHRNDTTERHRYVAGARARFFLSSALAISGEYARIFSKYPQPGLNERWNHLAIVAEVKIPKLGGWFSFAYGGDSAHRTDKAAKFAINYAVYADQLIKK
ncbi:hypothetical protein LT679_04420 [Mucilaginibacter roseus]|uniref:DUF2219 family protein n=1 Tax=Mucilaginibacter roseus TaxID=1528868 RepID=A0ABS8TZK0_9SPHI|nr:hypothetical protein [Mucilaginibacter roseus]MCD8739837.1 hypothetical protein [Mucilaginibacter roseus]